MKKLIIFIYSCFVLSALAAEFPAQGRIYLGMTQADPKVFNAELTNLSLKNVDGATFYGAEILFPVMKILDVGLRYTKHLQRNDENPSSEATDFYSEIDQDALAATIRVPFFKTNILRIDAFAGYGGSNTIIKLESASQSGTLVKKDSGSWFAEPYSVYGASLGVGYNQIYFC